MDVKRVLVRLAGIALLVAAIAGLIFCIAALIFVPRAERRLEATATEQLELVDEALTVTADGLAVAGTSLARATAAIASLEGTLGGVGKAINGTVPMLDKVAEILGEELPATLATTQDTLRAVATGARVVDDVLAIITAIPFLNLDIYDPDEPLLQGFEDVADSLEWIPESIGSAQEDLNSTVGSLQKAESDFATMATDVGAIANDLNNAQSVIIQYQGVVSELQDRVALAHQSLPGWLRAARWGLSLMLIWLGVAQIGLAAQGWELIERSRTKPPASAE